MSLRIIIIGILLIWAESFLPEPEGLCSWDCHNTGQCHGIEMYQDLLPAFIVEPGMQLYMGTVAWLKGMGEYRAANLWVYGIAFPLLGLLFSYGFRFRWYIFFLAAALSIHFALQPNWYDMCVEFCYRMGNWTGLSYVGVCAFVCILIPAGALLFDFSATVIKLWRGHSQARPKRKLQLAK